MATGQSGGTWTGGRAGTRASDADRDIVAGMLRTAYAEGRLSNADLDERMGRAMTASTFGDLDRVVGDLTAPAVLAAGRTNNLAIVSLCCAFGQIIAGPFAAVVAIVCGHLARREIRRTGEQGDGMALAGLIIGYLGLALSALFIVLIIAVFAAGTLRIGTGHPAVRHAIFG